MVGSTDDIQILLLENHSLAQQEVYQTDKTIYFIIRTMVKCYLHDISKTLYYFDLKNGAK